MKFIDQTDVIARSGDGGSGLLSFHRARNRPKLGPNGGNGGNGGDIVFVADVGLNTLSHLRYRRTYKAESGEPGGPNGRTGRCGKPCYIKVPLGTLVFDQQTNTLLCELTKPFQEALVAKGGKRGYGNMAFTTSTRQAPYIATEGKEGTDLALRCELKVLADVGLAGFPNAGKSTLLSSLSAAKPKIADYPFTTLHPQLGVIDLEPWTGERESFVLADIPGLVEGASTGKGLGHQFLKHLQRTKLLVFVLDGSSPHTQNLLTDYKLLKKELKEFQKDLANKEIIIAVNKADIPKDDIATQAKAIEDLGIDVFHISAVSQKGLKELLGHVHIKLQKIKQPND